MKRAAFAVPAFAAVLCASASAVALEPGQIGDEPVHMDVTEAGSVLYNFDNRNFRANEINTATDDKWGMLYNRLNVQASWGHFQAGLRLDGAWFYTYQDADQVAARMLANRPPPLPGEVRQPGDEQAYYAAQRQNAAKDLSTRFQNVLYPAKYYVGYTTPDYDITAGDVYAQLGRGLVLSVRKYDELSSDTTIRGARATGHLRAGDLRLDVTALGGTANPLRIDEASGRVLTVFPAGSSDTLIKGAEAGMPQPRDGARISYFTDRIAAGQIEGGTHLVVLGVRGALLYRDNPPSGQVRQRDTQIGSVSASLPDLGGHGAAYVEFAEEHNTALSAQDQPAPGSAVYGSLSLIESPVTVLFEGKHYRKFYPLSANVDTNAAGEFKTVQYSAPPTTESIYTDTEFNFANVCTSGGRVKTDVAVSDNDTLYAWVGRYASWGEASNTCDVSVQDRTDTWDFAVGLEKSAHHHKSRANIVVGVRDDRTPDVRDTNAGPTRVFYREEYGRYDIIEWIGGPFSIQLQGWHRYRFETDRFGKPWFEGEHLTGFQWAPRWVIAAGVEYDTAPGVPNTYFNGQLRYNFTSDSSASLFVGQRRGALRCVSGVCRVFPPFEGARLDVTARF